MLAVLLRRGSLPGMANGPVWRLIGTTADRPAAADVHADEVGRAVRRLRRPRRGARRRHRVHVRPRRAAQPTQPRAVRHRAAVRPGVGDLGHQRLVLRRQLRRAVVRQAAGDRRPPGDRRSSWCWRSSPACSPAGCTSGWTTPGTPRSRTPAQPRAGVHPAAGRRDHHGAARGGLDGQGRGRPLPRLHHRQGQRRRASRPGCRTPAAPWPTTCSSSPTPMPACCNRFRARASARTARSAGSTRSGFTPNGVSDTLDPPEPVTANPGTVNSDGSPEQAERRHRLLGGHRRRLRTRRRQRIAGVPAVRARPRPHPRDGQLRARTPIAAKATSAWYQLPPRTPDRPLVTVAAAGAIWSYDEEGTFNYGQSLKLQWGVQQARRHVRRRCGQVQPIDIAARRGRGATCASRWRGRRRRPTSPASSPTTRTCPPTSGSRSRRRACPCCETAQQFLGSQTPVLMDIATAANFPCQRPFAEHLGVAELPEYRILPNFKQIVVSSNHVAVRRGRRPVPVHPGAAARRRRSRRICATTGTATGARSSATSAVVPRTDAPDAVIDAGHRSGCSAGAAAARSGRCHDRGPMSDVMKDVKVARWVAIDRRPDRLRAVGAHAAAAGRADHRDAELAAGRAADQRHRAADHADAGDHDRRPCRATSSATMPPAGGLVLGTAPADGKQAALNALFVNVTSDPRRHHRPQRRGGQRAAGEGGRHRSAPDVRASRSRRRRTGTFATFVGLTGDQRRQADLRSGFPDPNLRPAIVGVFTDLTGPAPQGLSLSATIDTRFTTQPTALKLAAMLLAIVATVIALLALWRLDQLDGRRMHRAHPVALAHVHRRRRRGDRRLPALARHRRQLVRRRLHPADGPRRRPRRLHVELLPLVRQPRGPVRLVLQPAGADDARQRRQHLDAAAGPDLRAGVLAAAVPRGAAPPRARGVGQPARAVGGGPGAAGGVDAVQQRPAPRGPDRHRRADHLRADRAGDHLRAGSPPPRWRSPPPRSRSASSRRA